MLKRSKAGHPVRSRTRKNIEKCAAPKRNRPTGLKTQRPWNVEFEGSHTLKANTIFKPIQNDSPELHGYLFNNRYHRDDPTNPPKCLNFHGQFRIEISGRHEICWGRLFLNKKDKLCEVNMMQLGRSDAIDMNKNERRSLRLEYIKIESCCCSRLVVVVAVSYTHLTLPTILRV